jgi:hypothetical protein
MSSERQELHLWPALSGTRPVLVRERLPALRLPNEPAAISLTPLACVPLGQGVGPGDVLVEPVLNQRQQLKLLMRFPEAAFPVVNGEPAPRLFVLGPADFVQWGQGPGFHVALFSRPQIGPPPAAVLGKPCAVCRVPFVADSICTTCLCGAVLHCEQDRQEGLQCAQLRPDCPVCRRPLMLTEGYVNPPCDEE